MEPPAPRSDGWEAIIEEGQFDGWPLGLHAARVSIASTSTFLISTPSATSSSSSEFDTESTGSFFPEKSTTLGSLIGFQSSSQLALEHVSAMEADKGKNTSNGSNSRSRAWWSLLGCRGSLRDTMSDVPPSSTDFITQERRETLSQSTGEHHSHGHAEVHGHLSETASHRNAPYDIERETVANPSNPPTLRFILQHPSPTFSLSSGWDIYSNISHNHRTQGEQSRSIGQSHTFWPSLCGRLSTRVAN